MAICTFGGGVTGIRGSIGGSTFSVGHSGPTIRRRQKPHYNRSNVQGKRNAELLVAAQYWRDELTPANRADWATLAAATDFINALGQTYQVQPNALYIRSHTALESAGQAPAPAPPTNATQAAGDMTLSANNDPKVFVETWPNFVAAPAGRFDCWVSHAVPPSQNYTPTTFRHAVPQALGNFAGLPQQILGAVFLEAGKRYFVRMRYVRTAGGQDGRVSFVTILPINVPA